MTIEMLVAVFTILLTISLAAERLIEIARPLIEKIQDPKWQASIKIAAAVLVSFELAALFKFDMLLRLGVTATAPVIGYALAGLMASTGSSVLHPILEWLKTLQKPNDKTVTVEKTITKSTSTPQLTEPGA